MQEEINVLYGLVLIKCNYLYNEHPINLILKRTNDPKYCNVELNGNTLAFAYETGPTSFLRIAILKARLNADVQFIGKWGEPQTHDPNSVVFAQEEYAFVDHAQFGKGWTEAPSHKKFSTSKQLVEDSFEKFLDEAIKNPVN